jgi:hypothetical protein
MKNIYPLNSTFMLASILLILFSAYNPLRINITWSFLFFIFGTLMFISSLISLAHAPSKGEYIEKLFNERQDLLKKERILRKQEEDITEELKKIKI